MDKDEILRDAIECYFEAEVKISKLQRAVIGLGIIDVILIVALIFVGG